MSTQIAREYLGSGITVYVELEDEIYSVMVMDSRKDYPLTYSNFPRQRPALRVFHELITKLKEGTL